MVAMLMPERTINILPAFSSASANCARTLKSLRRRRLGRVIVQSGDRDGDRAGIFGDGPKYDFDFVAIRPASTSTAPCPSPTIGSVAAMRVDNIAAHCIPRALDTAAARRLTCADFTGFY
jgi:hypothetical protein